MIFLKALILGLIQGFSEFFPISSSAHLTIFKSFLDFKVGSNFFLFDLICHLATTIVALYFLKKEIIRILSKDKKDIFFIFLAILPLFPIYFFLYPLVKKLSSENFLGFFLLLSSFLLFLASSKRDKKISSQLVSRKIWDVLFIGVMQGMALLPGMSRSAATISGATFLGWRIKEAVYFSFLLAIPTIFGGIFLETIKAIKAEDLLYISQVEIFTYIISFFSALISGFIAARFIFSIKNVKKLKPFAWYCLFIGIFSIIYFNIKSL